MLQWQEQRERQLRHNENESGIKQNEAKFPAANVTTNHHTTQFKNVRHCWGRVRQPEDSSYPLTGAEWRQTGSPITSRTRLTCDNHLLVIIRWIKKKNGSGFGLHTALPPADVLFSFDGWCWRESHLSSGTWPLVGCPCSSGRFYSHKCQHH